MADRPGRKCRPIIPYRTWNDQVWVTNQFDHNWMFMATREVDQFGIPRSRWSIIESGRREMYLPDSFVLHVQLRCLNFKLVRFSTSRRSDRLVWNYRLSQQYSNSASLSFLCLDDRREEWLKFLLGYIRGRYRSSMGAHSPKKYVQ